MVFTAMMKKNDLECRKKRETDLRLWYSQVRKMRRNLQRVWEVATSEVGGEPRSSSLPGLKLREVGGCCVQTQRKTGLGNVEVIGNFDTRVSLKWWVWKSGLSGFRGKVNFNYQREQRNEPIAGVWTQFYLRGKIFQEICIIGIIYQRRSNDQETRRET